MPTLTSKQKRELKSQANLLNPIVMIGVKGLTDTVHNEIERALNDHGLIKLRFLQRDRAYQKEATALIIQHHQAELITAVGHVIVIYRPQQEN
jgi:RNA-binding protein